MFENFIVCKRVFTLEQKVIKILLQLKSSLIQEKDSLLCHGLKRNSNIISTLLKRCACRIKTMPQRFMKNKSYKRDEAIKQTAHLFPKKYDFEGAVKAMVTLYTTYNFDLTKTRTYSFTHSSSSEISFIDFSNTPHIVSFPSVESLVHDDFILLSHRSGHFYNFYDAAIYFIKEAFDSFEEYVSSPRLYEYLMEMKTNLTETHNNFLLGTQKRIGINFMVAPYLFGDSLQPVDGKIEWKGKYTAIRLTMLVADQISSLIFVNSMKLIFYYIYINIYECSR